MSLEQLIEKLKDKDKYLLQDTLDELVLSSKESEASLINNEGIDAQIEYLIESGFSEKDLIKELSNI